MAAFRLLVCFVITTFWFCSLINAAAVHSLIFGGQPKVLSEDMREIGIENLARAEASERLRSHRSIDSDIHRVCHSTTPCGWAVYVPFTRRVDYFMRNTCTCPVTFKCIRTDDDLSVSAYVYRCRYNTSASDIESPVDETTN